MIIGLPTICTVNGLKKLTEFYKRESLSPVLEVNVKDTVSQVSVTAMRNNGQGCS